MAEAKLRTPNTWAKAIPIVIALTLVWAIMNERLNVIVAVSGVIVAVAALVVTRILIGKSYSEKYWIGWRAGLLYFPYLIGQIVISAYWMARAIVKNRDFTRQFEYHSSLDDDLSLFLLASSIILTPGSIAISRKENVITVVSIEEDPDVASADCAKLERRIASLRRRNNLGSPPVAKGGQQ
jgi:multisubunit Na+/H+ antiporter MnhE subunit